MHLAPGYLFPMRNAPCTASGPYSEPTTAHPTKGIGEAGEPRGLLPLGLNALGRERR